MANSTRKARSALERAITVFGSPEALSLKLGKHKSAVGKWRERGQVSHTCVLKVEELTGVPCYELRPDLYRKPLTQRTV
jgi:DNA-binding transcriptional regulator YdaS (Cro superfamily)